MGLVPIKPLARLQFYENHTSGWASAAVAIGTTTAAVTDLTTKATAARAAYDAQQNALNAAKMATQAWRQSMAALSLAGSAILDQIRGKAKVSGDSIYTLANIPAPATPTPVPPPGTPFELKVALKPDGSLELKWKCSNPAGATGTFYQIARKVDGATAFDYLATVGTRTFTDETLPAGAKTVLYQIQAGRTTAMGVAQQFIVNIGVGSGGGLTVSVVEASDAPNGPRKIAA